MNKITHVNEVKRGGSMNNGNGMMKRVAQLGLLLMMGVSMNAEAGYSVTQWSGKRK
jgi:hypothetical protein